MPLRGLNRRPAIATEFVAHRFSDDHQMLFITERPNGGGNGNGNGGGTVTEYAVDLNDTETTYTIAEYDSDDFYGNPGSIINQNCSARDCNTSMAAAVISANVGLS